MQQHGSKYIAGRHTLDPGLVKKGHNIFMQIVMLHIKLNVIEHRAPR